MKVWHSVVFSPGEILVRKEIYYKYTCTSLLMLSNFRAWAINTRARNQMGYVM